MNNDYLVPIVIALIGALPGFWALLTQRREREATAASTITGAATDLVEQYKANVEKLEFTVNENAALVKLQGDQLYEFQKRINTLEGQAEVYQKEITSLRREVEVLRVRVREYRQGIVALITQIEGLGASPAYQLKPGDE